MCGIAGVVSSVHQGAVFPMAEALAHRGPDGDGFFQDSRIGLAHRRLSIVDVEGGAQPISSPNNRYQLICNGEIYNSPELRARSERDGYRFKTRTDVEVILPLFKEYGTECVKHLRGMFAFAIWDTLDDQLFLARDHMGQKPLFFAEVGETFLFASEPKAILASGLVSPEPDLEALWHYMSLRFIPEDRSLFRGIKKLEAGHTLLFRSGDSRLHQYWVPTFRPKFQLKEADLLDLLDEEMSQAVQVHKQSDVPVGAFLSGGIDSSLVSAMMSSGSQGPVPVFTIGSSDPSYDEAPYAEMVSEAYGLESHVQVVEPDLIRLAPAMIRALDEPADPFGVGLFLVSRLASDHVKVVLTGDGGDETYGGYDRYFGQTLVDYYGALPAFVRRQVLGRLIQFVPETFSYKSMAQKLSWMNAMSFHSEGERYGESLSFHRFTHAAKERLWTESARVSLGAPHSTGIIREFFDADTVDELVDRMLYTDLMTRMPDHLLTMGDRMSMAHSVEARPVLVDRKLVEFAGRVPGRFKVRRGRLKYLLRKLAERYLPPAVVNRPKQGFSFPIGHWLRTDLKGFTERLLGESRFVEAGIFRREAISEMVDEHMNGRMDHNYRIWMLINLELWYRMYMESMGVDTLVEMTDRLVASG